MKKTFCTSLFLTGIILITLLTGCAGNYNRVNAEEYTYDSDLEYSDAPPITFHEPPELVVFPNTYIYVVPDASVDIFFYNGWWWRPWNGRWYRSEHYNSGWHHYRNTPSFYRNIPRGWRNDYRSHRWEGHQWNHERIPHKNVQRNWREWEKSRYWEKKHNWGVQMERSRTRSQEPDRNHNNRIERPDRDRDHNNRIERPGRERDHNNRIERPDRDRDHNNRIDRPGRERDQNNRIERPGREQNQNNRPSQEIRQQDNRPRKQRDGESSEQQGRTPIEEQFENIDNNK